MTRPLASISHRSFGKAPSGEPVDLYTLKNVQGMEVDITNYGGIITRLLAPDRAGALEDVVLGFPTLGQYVTESPYFGALIGRVGNRIAGGTFKLDSRTYVLALNNTPNGVPCHLHGGNVGFDKVIWAAEPFVSNGTPTLRLHYLSRDGEEGYPGNLETTVTYHLSDDNELSVRYQAKTDRATPINLTQHSYFNLRGDKAGSILDHFVIIFGSRLTVVNKGLIPTGELRPVGDTPFDFTKPMPIGARIKADDEQLHFAGGYDHNWVLDRKGPGLQLAASAYEPVSGRSLEVWTEEPGMQFYSGNFLDGLLVGKYGQVYRRHSGFCFETQHSPDSPNQPTFPSVILHPGETYQTSTAFRFSAK